MQTFSLRAGPLHVCVGSGRLLNRRWSAPLSRFFDIGRELLRRLTAETAAGRLQAPAFLHGPGDDLGLDAALLEEIDCDYPLTLVSPFEETASIAGGLWSGRELFGPEFNDGLAKLRFHASTLDLPLHVHEHSDRVIAVVAGSGRFWWTEQPFRKFDGADVRFVAVRPGDALVFTRNLLHTFSAPDDDLLLLSYHSPEIPFDDPRQYSLPKLRWTPRDAEFQ